MYTGSLVIYALVSASTLHKNISCSLSEGSPEQPSRLLELGLYLRFYLHHTVKSFRLGIFLRVESRIVTHVPIYTSNISILDSIPFLPFQNIMQLS